MKNKLLIIMILLTASFALNSQSNGTRPDSDKVITGSYVKRIIPVLANDNAVSGKNYKLFSVYYSTMSPSSKITIGMQGDNATFEDKQINTGLDTFFYVAQDLNTSTFDTNYVVITHDSLSLDLYPGDANKDNLCNNIDVLNIGIAFGKSQIIREGVYLTNDWVPVRAYDWSQANNKSNFRYSDANGDGTVDSTGDVGTIYKNYNRTSNLTSVSYSPTGGSIFEIITLDTFKVASPNSSFQIKINLGTTTTVVSRAYGIAFTFKYDTSLIKAANISFKASKWFADQQLTLNFFKVNDQTGEVDMAIVRKSGTNDNGFGELGVVDVVIDDILGGLAGGINTNFEIQKAVLIDSIYNLLPVSLATPKPVHLVKKVASSIQNATNSKSLNYYINSNDNLILENRKMNPIEISIFNILGKQVSKKVLNSMQTADIDVSNWSTGIYFIKTNSEVYKITVK